jgi:hypothetical protein
VQERNCQTPQALSCHGRGITAGAWRDVDRDELIQLLGSGLTPGEVGARYGCSADNVRLRARTWGLNCRALRARAIGLAVKHPVIASQFVKVIDGAPLHYRPEDLLAGSGARCRWRCSDCGEEWITSVCNRTNRRSGCPVCAARAAVDRARARPATSPPLATVSDDLVREFHKNLTRPDRDVSSTPSGSNDRILWRCRRGHEWETSARQRAKYRTQCPACLAGLWTSRLEHQVAALVELTTGLEVRVGTRRKRTHSRATEHLDLLVVEVDFLCDLDPTRWHRAESAVARDLRKLERLAGQRYVRVRPQGLGRLPTDRAQWDQQVLLLDKDESDPWLWASAVIRALCTRFPTLAVQSPTVGERAVALVEADRRWRQLCAGSRERSLLTEFPTVAEQLVHVVDRPDLTAADIAPSGDERAVWRCPDCGHEWEARVANRTVLRTGCPPCSHRRSRTLAARPTPGKSFADEHPELVPYFRRDETNPGLTLTDLRPNSIDQCLWACPHCGREWIARPQALHRNPQAGCRACGYERSARRRRDRPRTPDPGDSFADRHPQLVEQFVENLTHPGVGLDRLRPQSRSLCMWRCPYCGDQWQAPVHARHRHPNGGCKTCGPARRRPRPVA